MHQLATEAPELGPLHPSLETWFNTWWFAELDGNLGQFGLTLEPVLPGIELCSFVTKARGYMAAHGGLLTNVPLGVELNGLLVVVNNRSGEVALEDFERNTFETLAPSLQHLIERLL